MQGQNMVRQVHLSTTKEQVNCVYTHSWRSLRCCLCLMSAPCQQKLATPRNGSNAVIDMLCTCKDVDLTYVPATPASF